MLNKDELKKILLEKKRDILSHIVNSKTEEENLNEATNEPMDREDWATYTISEETISLLTSKELELLRSIDRALERLEQGTYGICEICNAEIEEERLEILPWTNLCAKCSQKYSG